MLPPPPVGGGIRSEVTRLRIGRAIGVLPSLDEANIPSGWGGVCPEVISPPIGRGEHPIRLGRGRPRDDLTPAYVRGFEHVGYGAVV